MALSFTGPYPATYGTFSPSFHQPAVPKVATELKGQFLQHKWDSELSHITAGYWYNSAQQGKVRVDEAYGGGFASSLFDYTDTNADGGIMNHLVTVEPSVGSKQSCFDDYVGVPGFPLITDDFLQSNNATFGGVVQEPLLGATQTWDFLLGGSISVITYLNTNGILVGYDIWGADRKTKVITRFFAQEAGPIAVEVFKDFPCPKKGAK